MNITYSPIINRVTLEISEAQFKILGLLVHSSQNVELIEETIEDAEDDPEATPVCFDLSDFEDLQNHIPDIE